MTLGRARIVRRWTPTWPSRKVPYYDLTPWGGGYMRIQGAPGAIHLKDGICADIRTGEVYRDKRFESAHA